MTAAPIDMNAVGEAGMAALHGDDPKLARELFEQIIAAGEADATVWLVTALARKAMGDAPATHEALDQMLKIDPENLRALLMKADCLAEDGDSRSAVVFYDTVLRLAPDPDTFPPEIAREIRRAKVACEKHSTNVLAHIKAELVKAGYDEASSSHRITMSLDLLSGKKKRYVEQPRTYFVPELPVTEFFPRETFPWMSAMEAATDDIADELAAVMDQKDAFAPYIHAEENRPTRTDHNLLDSLDWSALYLWRDGTLIEENAARFPKTMAALENVPLEYVDGKAPMALFSRLEPGAHIKPHTGFFNSRVICHLPIIAPPDCFLRVGNETREWRRGEGWVFSDAIEHEAWNASSQTRVVLIFSVWRPELSDEERMLIAKLLRSVDTFGDTRGQGTA